MTDDHHLLARYRQHQHHARILTQLSLETGQPANQAKPTPPGGDPWALRGIPAIGYGIPGGAIPGTRPDQTPSDD